MQDISTRPAVARKGAARAYDRAWFQHRRQGESLYMPRLLGMVLAVNAGIIGALLFAGGTASLGFTAIHGALLGASELALILFLLKARN